MKLKSIYNPSREGEFLINYIPNHLSAGFPSAVSDSLSEKIDLNSWLIKHPEATFFMKVSGNSMQGAGIYDQDILIVDRALDPKSEDIVVACINNDFTVKRLEIKAGVLFLHAENLAYPSIEITEEFDFFIWGVVTYAIHRTR